MYDYSKLWRMITSFSEISTMSEQSNDEHEMVFKILRNIQTKIFVGNKFPQKTRLANRKTRIVPRTSKNSPLFRGDYRRTGKCNDRNDNPITPWPFSPFSLSLSLLAYISRLRDIQRKLVFTRVLACSLLERERERERESQVAAVTKRWLIRRKTCAA